MHLLVDTLNRNELSRWVSITAVCRPGAMPLFYLRGPQRLSAYELNKFYGNQFVAGWFPEAIGCDFRADNNKPTS
jgi:hypothetical protein